MPVSTNSPLRYRQIHLDFHTSEHIPGIGAAFDADEFVGTLKKASVDSITIFAKCHHGWSYYPTKVGAPHPNIARPDLMGDMVKALNAADLRRRFFGLTVTDATALVHGMRRLKGPEEIVQMEQAVLVTREAVEHVMRVARPGMREHELEGEVLRIYRSHNAGLAFEKEGAAESEGEIECGRQRAVGDIVACGQELGGGVDGRGKRLGHGSPADAPAAEESGALGR